MKIPPILPPSPRHARLLSLLAFLRFAEIWNERIWIKMAVFSRDNRGTRWPT
jgi:hypothetical protein